VGYHTNDELSDCVVEWSARAGSRSREAVIGETAEGRAIRSATVAAPGHVPDESRPQVLATGNIHGAEVIGSEVALAILDALTAPKPGPRATTLLELADVTVVPAVNLDARARSLEACAGWGAGRAPRRNARGVDLNRNFPYPDGANDPWHPLAGTQVRWLPWYRGPEPLSEPETRALVELCDRLRPCASVSLHSVGRLFLYPYCYSAEEPADVGAFRAMGAAFREAQPGVKYTVKQSHSWYTILGDMDDWLYDTYGTLAFTVELSMPLAGVGWNPLRVLNQFAWANPRSPRGPIADASEACLAALAEGCRRRAGQAPP
jgi:predicted deacylase